MGIASVIHRLAIQNVVASTILASKLTKSSGNNIGKTKQLETFLDQGSPRISSALPCKFHSICVDRLDTLSLIEVLSNLHHMEQSGDKC